MSLARPLATFRTGTYTVTRRAPDDTYVNGRAVPGTPLTFTIDASVQPFSGRQVQPLPEGVRAEDVRVLFTATELRVADNEAGAGDTIVIPTPSGTPETFVVWRVDGPWTMRGFTHYEVYAARRGKP